MEPTPLQNSNKKDIKETGSISDDSPYGCVGNKIYWPRTGLLEEVVSIAGNIINIRRGFEDKYLLRTSSSVFVVVE